MEDNIKMGIQ